MQGSFHNRMMEQAKQLVPEVGMGATKLMYTDRQAFTIVEVSKNGKTITVQRDKAVRADTNGMSDSQAYTYERDTDGEKIKVSLRKDGRWRETGQRNGTCFLIGHRDEHWDYSF